jgi:hypothetical protein
LAWPATLEMSTEDLSRLFHCATHAVVSAANGEGVVNTAAALLASRFSCGLLASRLPVALMLLIALAAAGAATAVPGFWSDGGRRADPPPVPAAGTAPAPQPRAEPQESIDPDDPATADISPANREGET